MRRDYAVVHWDSRLEDDCRDLIHQAVIEDLENQADWTTLALVDDEAQGAAQIVARSPGVLAGARVVPLVLEATQAELVWTPERSDSDLLERGSCVGTLRGNARDLLTLERTVLNFVGRLSGIASLTAQYVAQTAGTAARIYDTRKTTPGWRRLEKYAVRCGGGVNHRLGLYAGVMIKDNHLAFWSSQRATMAAAVQAVRQMLEQANPLTTEGSPLLIEVEVDSIEQLRAVLPANPDIVLLDNMTPDTLREAVEVRNAMAPHIELEASGGVNLKTVAAIAATGVERISAGALTHSAPNLDLGLDWLPNG